LVINQAARFRSPLRGGGITTHSRGDRRALNTLISHCISELRNVAERSRIDEEGLDAKCAIVVDMDNVALDATQFETRPPAPQVGDPLHYDAFLQRICEQYEQRFATG